MTDQLSAVDLYARETRANPQAVYAILRREDPIYRIVDPNNGLIYWLLTRYEDCVTILKDPRFGKEISKHVPPHLANQYTLPENSPFRATERHLLNLDPPDHTRLRGLVHKAFTPAIIEGLRPRIQQIANDLIDAVIDRGQMDLIADFGFPLPITVIAEMLGVPVADRDKFRQWTRPLVFGGPDQEVMLAVLEFTNYMNFMLDDARTHPREDLLSGLVRAEENGQRLDRMELLSMLFLLLVAGHETTVNLIGNGTLALLQHRDQLDRLRADPTLIRSAVEEMLRYNGPVETTTWRWVFEDLEFGGKHIQQREIMLPVLLAANRDPAVFDDPDRFDIAREPNRHIAFGNGIHFCLGAPLARLEGAIAIDTLVRRLPDLELQPGAADRLEWSDSLLLHGLKALPVQF